MSIKASNNPFPHDPDYNWKEKLDRGGYPGTAKDLFDKISQIDAPDGILIAGEITRIGNVFSIGASTFTCRIKQEELINQDDFSTTIVNASDNYKRIDILVFTKFSTILKIQGDEDLVSAKEPDVPTGTIKLAFFSIFGNQVDEHNEPIIIPDISEKLDRGGFEGTAQDIVNAIPDPSEFWRKLDKDGYDGTAQTLKDEIDSGLLLKENKANKATDFSTVNDILFPTVKASKTYTDNVGTTKLDKNNAATSNPQAYIKKADGTQSMFEIESVLSGSANKLPDGSSVKTYVDNGLSTKENLSNKAVNFDIINDILYPTVKSVKTQLDTKIPASEKGSVNGVASLGNDGKIPNSQIPALAISETFPVNSQVAMLALSQADQGDIAIRSDISKSFILRVSPASVLGNWSELLTPTDSVQSVNGQVGNVNLTTADIQDSTNKRYQTDNQKLFNDATSSIQTQLNSKQANLGYTPEPAFSKNTAFNKNFGTVAGTVAEGNDARILNGQTAFGWGDHAVAGYALSNGSNASGTWAINISGRASIATNSDNASRWGGVPTEFTAGDQSVSLGAVIGRGTDGNAYTFNTTAVKTFLGLSNAITGTGAENYLAKFTGAGTQVISQVFDNGTNVGIGTTNPLTKVNIDKSSQNYSSITPTGGLLISDITGAGTQRSIELGTDTANGIGYLQARNSASATWYNLALNPNGGNVGIGTPAPTVKLDVVQNNNSSAFIVKNGTNSFYVGNDADGAFLGGYKVDNSNFIPLQLQKFGGNVGIGTANPLHKFVVSNNNTNGFEIYVPTTPSEGIAIQSYDRQINDFRPMQYVASNHSFSGGNATFLGTVTAPTFNGNLNGNASSATNWGGRPADLNAVNNSVGHVLVRSGDGVTRLADASGINSFIGLNNGSTLSNSITGNAGTANSAINWGGFPANFNEVTGSLDYIAVRDVVAGKITLATSGTIRNWLGLGSNAYTSTAYLPLTGGTISGALGVTNFISTPNVIAPLMTLQGGVFPYIQFNTDAGTRRGYIQHNESTFIIKSEVGTITLDNNTIVSGTITASGGFFNSDERLKNIIKRDGNVAYFKWKDGRDDKTHIGYIAQEVQKTNPDQVIKGKDGILSVNYIEILVQEIQSLKKEIQEMKGGNYGVC